MSNEPSKDPILRGLIEREKTRAIRRATIYGANTNGDRAAFILPDTDPLSDFVADPMGVNPGGPANARLVYQVSIPAGVSLTTAWFSGVVQPNDGSPYGFTQKHTAYLSRDLGKTYVNPELIDNRVTPAPTDPVTGLPTGVRFVDADFYYYPQEITGREMRVVIAKGVTRGKAEATISVSRMDKPDAVADTDMLADHGLDTTAVGGKNVGHQIVLGPLYGGDPRDGEDADPDDSPNAYGQTFNGVVDTDTDAVALTSYRPSAATTVKGSWHSGHEVKHDAVDEAAFIYWRNWSVRPAGYGGRATVTFAYGLDEADAGYVHHHQFDATIAEKVEYVGVASAPYTLAVTDYFGRNDLGTTTYEMAQIGVDVTDPGHGSEASEVWFKPRWAGALTDGFRIGRGLYSPLASGGDPGDGGANFKSLYIDGVLALGVDTMAPATPTGISDPPSQALRTSAGGTQQIVVTWTWTANTEPDLAGYVVAYRRATSGAFVTAKVEDPSFSLQANAGEVLQIKVLAHDWQHNKSAYTAVSPAAGYTVTGDSTAPGVVTVALAPVARPKGVVMKVTAPSDANTGGLALYCAVNGGAAALVEYKPCKPGRLVKFRDDDPHTVGDSLAYSVASVNQDLVESATKTSLGSAVTFAGVKSTDFQDASGVVQSDKTLLNNKAMATKSYNKNPTFQNWTGTDPDNYAVTGTLTTSKGVSSPLYGDFSFDVAYVASDAYHRSTGTEVRVPGTADDYVFIEYDISISAQTGTTGFNRAGVWLRVNYQDSSNYKSFLLDLSDKHPSPVTGQVYSGALVLPATVTGSPTGLPSSASLYIMGNYSLFSETVCAKTLRWHRVEIRRATKEEIRAYRAIDDSGLVDFDTVVTGSSKPAKKAGKVDVSAPTTNSLPSTYRALAGTDGLEKTEKKQASSIGITSTETYGKLKTLVPGPSTSDGRVTQQFHSDDGSIWKRSGAPADGSWNTWYVVRDTVNTASLADINSTEGIKLSGIEAGANVTETRYSKGGKVDASATGTDSNPSVYRALGAIRVEEQKTRTALGVSGSATDGVLSTKVASTTTGANTIHQEFVSADGAFKRRNSSESTWTAWKQVFTQEQPPSTTDLPDAGALSRKNAVDLSTSDVTNRKTSALTDDAALGQTATWTGVTGSGKAADNATVGATVGTDLKDSGGATLGVADVQNTSATFAARKRWAFKNSLQGFSVNHGSNAPSALYVTVTGTDPNQLNFAQAGLSLTGADCFRVRMRVRPKQTVHSWSGRCFYQTSGHSYSSSYMKQIAAPANWAVDEWRTLEWDMSNLTAGGADWIANTIIGLDVELGQTIGDAWDVAWIAVGDDGGDAPGLRGIADGADVTASNYSKGQLVDNGAGPTTDSAPSYYRAIAAARGSALRIEEWKDASGTASWPSTDTHAALETKVTDTATNGGVIKQTLTGSDGVWKRKSRNGVDGSWETTGYVSTAGWKTSFDQDNPPRTTDLPDAGRCSRLDPSDLTDITVLTITATGSTTYRIGVDPPTYGLTVTGGDYTIDIDMTGASGGVIPTIGDTLEIYNQPESDHNVVVHGAGATTTCKPGEAVTICYYFGGGTYDFRRVARRPILQQANGRLLGTQMGVGAVVQAWDGDLDALAAMTSPATLLARALQPGRTFYNDDAAHSVTWGADGPYVRVAGTYTGNHNLNLTQGTAIAGCPFYVDFESVGGFALNVKDAASGASLLTMTSPSGAVFRWNGTAFEYSRV